MRLKPVLAVILIALLSAPPAGAWFNGGHMTVAYIAYQLLNDQTRSRVDELLQRNPMYDTWTKRVADNQKGLVAFVRAATWPDCIKEVSCTKGYTDLGGDTPPGDPTDSQNIGYDDMLMHKYWHFVDLPYSAGADGVPPKTPNALTEIELLTQAIGSSKSDDIKSYDVVWLEHLVGDIHQPLHGTSRFTTNHPKGDAGGNDVAFCSRPCRDELHAYWDGLLGDKPTIQTVSTTGKALLARKKPAGADEADPSVWANASFGLAKTKVYVSPISDDNDPSTTISPRPDAAYAKTATSVAKGQVLLAGYRLANLLNNNLK